LEFLVIFIDCQTPGFIYGQHKHVVKFTLGTFLQRVQSNVNEALQSINAVCSKRLKINMQILNQMLKFSLQNCATTTLALLLLYISGRAFDLVFACLFINVLNIQHLCSEELR
jgi:hypothetical protein